MKSYQVSGQVWISLAGISIGFCILTALQVPIVNLILFWIVPMMGSSLQLFTFGIFLLYRKTEDDYRNSHSARSIGLPVVSSFLACYHFGYHWEHHQFPYIPWYQLPKVYWAGKG
jgi:beta-carotene ketolase (CrtW type)